MENTTDNTTGGLPWAEWIIDRYIRKSVYSAYFQVHHETTKESGSIERRDLYLPEELEAQLMRQGASVKSYSDFYLNEAVTRIQIAQQLNSIPGVIGIQDYESVPNIKSGYTMYIRRNYVQNLMEYQEENTLKMKEYVQGVCEICDALEACHKLDIVYGGLRPDSVYISEDKHFYIGTDYFFALRHIGERLDRFYMDGLSDSAAPETLNKGVCNPASDVYTVGLLLYCFFNEGKIPFLPLTQKKRNDHIYQGAIERRLRGERFLDPEDGTKELIAVIKKACDFDPEKRYQSIAELKADLVDLLEKNLITTYSEEEEEEDDDDFVSEDYKAEMALREKAQEYRKSNYLESDEKEEKGSFTFDNGRSREVQRRAVTKRSKILRVLAAVFLAGFMLLQVANSGFFPKGGRVAPQEQQTEMQTEQPAETEASE